MSNDDDRQRSREGLGFGPRAAAEELARDRAEWKRGDAYITSAVSVPERPYGAIAEKQLREWTLGRGPRPSWVPEKPVAERFADVTEANPPLGSYSERELLEELLLRLARRK